MTNEALAAVLDEIADLLEIGNAEVFRVRTYRRAAEVTRDFAGDVAALHAEHNLQSIPGIGKSLAATIGELIETGTCAHREELRAEFPPGLLEMLAIPGFGPKKAALVYRELGLTSVDELEAAARGQLVRKLPGLGAKSEEKLLHNIGLYRQSRERKLLGEAWPRAMELVALLTDHPAVRQVSPAGSLRRKRETIGDMDLLATSSDAPGICDFFAELPSFSEVLAHGDTKVSALFPDGLQVDLRVVEPVSYGAALLYFTGSKAHNIELRERAQRQGLTINEYGVFEVTPDGERGRQVAGETEEDVYAAVGLPWIAPELREARGEIEAAAAGRLPPLIERGDLRGDLQMHTRYSDGAATVEDMARAAIALGHEYIGITDHSVSLRVAGGLSEDDLRRQRDEIAAVNAKLAEEGVDCHVFHGTELEILSDGSLDYSEEVLAGLDFVLASIHQGFSPDEQRIMGRFRAALDNPYVTCIAHPTGRVINRREPYAVNMPQLIEWAAERDVALEINSYPERLDLNDINARLARDAGVDLLINTDAHRPAQLAFCDYGVAVARRGWLEAKDVVNTRPRAEFEQWLKRRRS